MDFEKQLGDYFDDQLFKTTIHKNDCLDEAHLNTFILLNIKLEVMAQKHTGL